MVEGSTETVWNLPPVEKGQLMTTFRDAAGRQVTRHTEVRCGLPSDAKLLGFRFEHVPGRRGAILHLTTEAGEMALDLHHLQVGQLICDAALSQRQAWEDDHLPDDMLEGERLSPPKWMGAMPQSRKVVELRTGRAA